MDNRNAMRNDKQTQYLKITPKNQPSKGVRVECDEPTQNIESLSNKIKSDNLSQYQILSEIGFSLIPINGKIPLEKDWTRWCREVRPFKEDDFKGHNAGICTGPASKIIVIDIDNRDLFIKWGEKENIGTLPSTRIHTTGGGGEHRIYRYPTDGRRYGNKARKDAGFDVRGDGGMIVAPGSIHPDTGKPYTVSMDQPIGEAPAWLLDLCRECPSVPSNLPTIDQSAWDRDIDSLPVRQATKDLIRCGAIRGKRSEAIMTVLNALVGAGVSEADIFRIFDAYPIGEKYRGKGNGKECWLRDEIESARRWVSISQLDKPQKAVPISETAKAPTSPRRGARLLNVEDIGSCLNSRDVTFIFRNHIPAAMPTMIVAREGMGKTTICLAIAKEMLETHPHEIVVWIASEGFLQDTVDKIDKLGIDRKRFFLLQHQNETFQFNFALSSDIQLLDQILRDQRSGGQKILAVFIDSIRGISPHDDNESKIKTVMLPAFPD